MRSNYRLGRRIVLPLLALVVATVPAGASDGVLEINQACIETGCFPGDDPGFPVQVGAGSYRLTSDVTTADTDTTAIVISSNRGSSTLDLGGFTLSGRYVCSASPPDCAIGTGTAILSEAGARLVLKNGFIRNFSENGARVSAGTSVIENVVFDNIRVEAILARTGSIIRNNIIRNAGDNGIRMNLGNQGGLIEGNVVEATGGDGIETGSSLVLRNHIMDAGDVCIRTGINAGYGENRVDCDTISGGVSFGTNACNGAAC